MPLDFSAIEHGLASRLVADRRVYKDGQPVWLYLDVFNDDAAPVSLVTGRGVWGLLQVTREDGEAPNASDGLQSTPPSGVERGTGSDPVPRNPAPADHVVTKAISPGKQANLIFFYLSGDDHAMFPVLEPGRYHAIWNSDNESVFHGKRLAPRSKPVVFEVLPRQDAEDVQGPIAAEVSFGPPSEQGLQSRVRSERAKYLAGQSVPIQVELQNTGSRAIGYLSLLAPEDLALEVLDASGQPVPPLLPAEERTAIPSTKNLEPAHTALLARLDLSERFFLQSPGQYSVTVPARPPSTPASNSFTFEILPAAIDDSLQRAIGILLKKCPKEWALAAPAPESGLQQPGPQWGRVPCRLFQFVHKSLVVDMGTRSDPLRLTFYLATEKAVEEPWDLKDYHKPMFTEYLGETPMGHVYLSPVKTAGINEWPSFRSDILKWLGE